MLKRFHYTDKELEKVCKSIVILIDGREKSNQHITDWFDKKKIKWKSKALDQGDYSFYIPANPDFNIDRDLYFDKEIMVERKNSLDEIAGNFTTHRARFEEELAIFPGKKYLLLERSTYGDIIEGNYKAKLNAKSFIGTLHSFNHRYNIEVVFMPDRNHSAAWLYGTFLYYLRNILK